MKPPFWKTAHLISVGITFQEGEHWWSLCVPRKVQTCYRCRRRLKLSSFCFKKRTGQPVYQCQPCGKASRERYSAEIALSGVQAR